MKIVHVNYDVRGGGASRIAASLHTGLLNKGIDSLLVTSQYSEELFPSQIRFGFNDLPFMEKALYWTRFKRASYVKRKITRLQSSGYYPFSYPHSLLKMEKLKAIREADIVHLHYVQDLFDILSLPALKARVAWTLHDFSPITGGCPQPHQCNGFETGCLSCPQLSGDRRLASGFLTSKMNLYNQVKKKIRFIAPSRFVSDLFDRSQVSGNAGICIISHGFDTGIFRLRDKFQCRTSLDLPAGEKIVLAINDHLNIRLKGHDEMIKLASMALINDFLVLNIGNTRLEGDRVINRGFIRDPEKLAAYYSAADFTFVPSVAETFGNTIAESLLCGTPVIAFNLAPMNENITHLKNGFLMDIADWEEQALDLISGEHHFNHLNIATTASEKFSLARFVDEHIGLYENLLN